MVFTKTNKKRHLIQM